MPPIRGKPYYTLMTIDDEQNSVNLPFSPKATYTSPLLLDAVSITGDEVRITVRVHKTAAQTGMYGFVVRDPIDDLLRFWVDKARPFLLEKLGLDHCHVFFHPSSGKPFSESSFSKYMKAAFIGVTGAELNLQKARRIFAKGLFHM
jgi:hypothetical protein